MTEKYAFIEEKNKYINVGLIENGRLIQYKRFGGLEGNIYRAPIEKYIKALKAFVVDLGLEKKGLLKAAKADDGIKANDHVIVELVRESQDHKLHDLTGHYTLTDGFIVLKKLKNKDSYKVILRTAGKKLDKDEIDKKEEILKQSFENISKTKNFLPSPKLLLANNRLQNFIDSLPYPVYSDKEYSDLKGLVVDPSFNRKNKLEIYRATSELESRVIKCHSGVELVFDTTEALNVIDINASGFKLDHDKKIHSFLVNRSCLDDLARLIAIKSIKNMLVIDFVRMDESQMKLIDREFKEALKKYGVRAQIFSFTKMGLYEMIVK